ncbi:unnamed protein product [Rotaria sordida]|uniref:Uncharacterized protein n=1 Tax=Rotaria sordida TaxID=392033 RepID=A0A818MP11_9BILA|nr:unnamed protein product [Rotaria sordida]CAF3592329.1 unnamed protein product [Rotaria sordida]CAF3697415.1 unnamed protein product [Rotaria sordida]
MSTNNKNFNLFQTATTQIKNLLSNDDNIKNKTNECIISNKPSTIDDTSDCMFNKNFDELFKRESDLYEEDKFRVCFIDCSCDCLAKKVTQGRMIPTENFEIFEKLLKNFKSNNYNVFCDCHCGDNQQRSFSFNYSAGQQKRTI